MLLPSWMATAYFALPCNFASLQPLLAGDRYKSQEFARQKTEQKDLSVLTFFDSLRKDFPPAPSFSNRHYFYCYHMWKILDKCVTQIATAWAMKA